MRQEIAGRGPEERRTILVPATLAAHRLSPASVRCDISPVIHPDTELRRVGSQIGYGVAATANIPHGTITWVRDDFDQRLDADAVARLPELLRVALKRYAYRDLDESYVLCWDHARFNNHSCRPACRTVGDFDIAVRDIAPGEELTIEYAVINVVDMFDCRCGAEQCRREVHSSDAVRYGEAWDAEVLAAMRLAPTIRQPLETLFAVSATLTSAFADASAGRPITLPASRDLVLPP